MSSSLSQSTQPDQQPKQSYKIWSRKEAIAVFQYALHNPDVTLRGPGGWHCFLSRNRWINRNASMCRDFYTRHKLDENYLRILNEFTDQEINQIMNSDLLNELQQLQE